MPNLPSCMYSRLPSPDFDIRSEDFSAVLPFRAFYAFSAAIVPVLPRYTRLTQVKSPIRRRPRGRARSAVRRSPGAVVTVTLVGDTSTVIPVGLGLFNPGHGDSEFAEWPRMARDSGGRSLTPPLECRSCRQWENVYAQQRMQRLVAAQQTCVNEALGAYWNGHQERHPRGGRLNLVRRLPLDRHVTPNLLHQTDLLQIGYENRDPAEGGYRSLGVTQNHALAREQSSDFLRNRTVAAPIRSRARQQPVSRYVGKTSETLRSERAASHPKSRRACRRSAGIARAGGRRPTTCGACTRPRRW